MHFLTKRPINASIYIFCLSCNQERSCLLRRFTLILSEKDKWLAPKHSEEAETVNAGLDIEAMALSLEILINFSWEVGAWC